MYMYVCMYIPKMHFYTSFVFVVNLLQIQINCCFTNKHEDNNANLYFLTP
jgi:hypothetical protein